MGVYSRAKFQVSSIILTNFRQGGNFTPSPPPPHPDETEALDTTCVDSIKYEFLVY